MAKFHILHTLIFGGGGIVMATLCTCRVAVLVFIFMLLMWCASGAALGAVIVSYICVQNFVYFNLIGYMCG